MRSVTKVRKMLAAATISGATLFSAGLGGCDGAMDLAKTGFQIGYNMTAGESPAALPNGQFGSAVQNSAGYGSNDPNEWWPF